MAHHHPHDRDTLEYELVVRQEPKQARMCGVGGKVDRRPIDPPPIVQLRVIDPSKPSTPRRRTFSASGSDPDSPPHLDPSSSRDAVSYTQCYLQNPYYFMFASLAKADDDAELHWLKDGRTRCTTGSGVSSMYHLRDLQNDNEDAGFFVFPNLSVRIEGSYRLKLSLFEVVGSNVRHRKSIYSAPFYVYTAKQFPGMEGMQHRLFGLPVIYWIV
ncbi:velvet factor-domain-containing protein [Amanita rubescens]|nr:velvet factor-domain-containing protein [Amanita rubescens]